MLRYAITSRQIFPGDEPERRDALILQARRLAADGIDILQVRERDLPERDLIDLTRRIVDAGRSVAGARLKLLVNGPANVAIAAGADGVHLRGGARTHNLEDVREAFRTAAFPPPLVSVSCHTVEETRQAALDGFDLILFGPVFEKRVDGQIVKPGLGLDRLREAAHLASLSRLLALGGVNETNAGQCVEAGAAGIAGIRIFL